MLSYKKKKYMEREKEEEEEKKCKRILEFGMKNFVIEIRVW